MLYNKEGSVFFKSAQRIKKDSRNIMAYLERLRIHHILPSMSDTTQDGQILKPTQEQDESAKHSKLSMIGDLEPDLGALELLILSDAIRADLNIELDNSTPIASLFNYELAKVKPPPPDSPLSDRARGGSMVEPSNLAIRTGAGGRKVGKRGKQKRDRKAEIEKARLNREAKAAAARAAASVATGPLTEGDDEALQTENRNRRKGKQKEREREATLDASARYRAPRGVSALEPDFHMEVQATTPDTADQLVSIPKKHGSVVPVAQPIAPMVVSTVDNRDSFSLFNAGWILPPNQKRGGRAPLPAQQLHHMGQPPPKKRQKIGMAFVLLALVPEC